MKLKLKSGRVAAGALVGIALSLLPPPAWADELDEEFRTLNRCTNQLYCLDWLSRYTSNVPRFDETNPTARAVTGAAEVEGGAAVTNECGPGMETYMGPRYIGISNRSGPRGRNGFYRFGSVNGRARWIDVHAQSTHGYILDRSGNNMGMPPAVSADRPNVRIVKVHIDGRWGYEQVIWHPPSGGKPGYYQPGAGLLDTLPAGVSDGRVPRVGTERVADASARTAYRTDLNGALETLGRIVQDSNRDAAQLAEEGNAIHDYGVYPTVANGDSDWRAWRGSWTEARRRGFCGALQGALDACNSLSLPAAASVREQIRTGGCLPATSGPAPGNPEAAPATP